MRSPEIILNIPYGSDLKTVKRAYVSALRQFDPQKEPERFAELKTAYNYMLLEDSTQGDDIYELEGPLGTLVTNVHSLIYQDNKPGIAIKRAQQILKEFPDSIWANKMMYMAYMARGWYKKAAFYDEILQKAGCSHPDYLLTKVSYYQQKGPLVNFTDEIKDYFAKRNYWPSFTRPIAMLLLSIWIETAYKNKDTKEMETIADTLILMIENQQLNDFSYLNDFYKWLGSSIANQEFSYPLLEKLNTMVDLFMKKHPVHQEEFLYSGNAQNGFTNLQNFSARILSHDPKYGDSEFFNLIAEYKLQKDGASRSAIFRSFDSLSCAKADAALYFIENKDAFLAYCKHIKKYYSLLYPPFEDFEAEIKNSITLPAYQEEQEKILRRYFMDYDFQFLSLCPAAQARLLKIHGKTNRKGTPSKKIKIGRNDPCPCGSGKKYKNCCGRK